MNFERIHTLEEIADLIAAEMIGEPGFGIKGINEIHMVEAGDLTFVDHPKYYKKALESKATTILINQKLECPQGKALLISDDPFRDYVYLVKRFRPFEPAEKHISQSAIIGDGTAIQAGAFIGNHVKIGKNCIIHSNVSIYDYTEIGNDVIIHSNTVIGADAFYFQKKPEGYRKLESCGHVRIGNRVEIGALSAIDRGVSGVTEIGDGTKIDNHVQIGHDTIVGRDCLIGAHTAIAGVTRIEDDVLIWAKVSINKDLVIGKGAVILATSGVDKSLEGGKTYFGIPVDVARKKWKELAMIRKLPEIIERIDS
ncbi:MAG: UDP-3-O-(3-hydroxymyristoyl)glucosamine N-acyltransferase [Bacteroidales bacterium]|nr:UDP-3-O-(3-hydroxymyristoyl)glucosamine N-acyltransferase [Bacteroidales bacterium]